ncbi:MAG: hypothetical protein D3919_06420 [Candidatus Electrothrix sp. AW5]|nr:hypothetical protein [Candidatus Electrothrix gigas]MCI5195859.1 hypothetical protein [Candidatus Electrothrix gigas]
MKICPSCRSLLLYLFGAFRWIALGYKNIFSRFRAVIS